MRRTRRRFGRREDRCAGTAGSRPILVRTERTARQMMTRPSVVPRQIPRVGKWTPSDPTRPTSDSVFLPVRAIGPVRSVEAPPATEPYGPEELSPEWPSFDIEPVPGVVPTGVVPEVPEPRAGTAEVGWPGVLPAGVEVRGPAGVSVGGVVAGGSPGVLPAGVDVGGPDVLPAGFAVVFPPVSGVQVLSEPELEESPGFVTVAENAWTDSPFACASALKRENAVDESACPRVVVPEVLESSPARSPLAKGTLAARTSAASSWSWDGASSASIRPSKRASAVPFPNGNQPSISSK